jgi:hypothetical protein
MATPRPIPRASVINPYADRIEAADTRAQIRALLNDAADDGNVEPGEFSVIFDLAKERRTEIDAANA